MPWPRRLFWASGLWAAFVMVTIGIHLCKCKRRRKTGKQLEIREGNRRGWLEGSHPSSNCLVFFSCFFYKSSSPLICVLSPALVVPPPPSPPLSSSSSRPPPSPFLKGCRCWYRRCSKLSFKLRVALLGEIACTSETTSQDVTNANFSSQEHTETGAFSLFCCPLFIVRNPI